MQKPEPKLTHMPFHIKQRITDSATNAGTKLALSQVSKQFQSLAKDSSIKYDELRIEMDADKVSVIRKACFPKPIYGVLYGGYLDGEDKKLVMEFSAHEDGVLMINPTSGWQKMLPEKDYRKAAVQYCLSIMNAKTRIEEFTLTTNEDVLDSGLGEDFFPNAYPKEKFEEDRTVVMDEIRKILPGLKHRLIIETITFGFQITDSELLQILLCLEPGTLQEIYPRPQFSYHIFINPIILNLEQISETEQWKGAKKLDIFNYKCDLPLEKWTNFEELSIRLTRPQLAMKEIIEKFISRPTFKKLTVGCSEGFDAAGVTEYLDQFEQELVEQDEEFRDDSTNLSIRLPNEPNSKVEISIEPTLLWIQRK